MDLSLPWTKLLPDDLQIEYQEHMDANHFGLDDIEANLGYVFRFDIAKKNATTDTFSYTSLIVC